MDAGARVTFNNFKTGTNYKYSKVSLTSKEFMDRQSTCNSNSVPKDIDIPMENHGPDVANKEVYEKFPLKKSTKSKKNSKKPQKAKIINKSPGNKDIEDKDKADLPDIELCPIIKSTKSKKNNKTSLKNQKIKCPIVEMANNELMKPLKMPDRTQHSYITPSKLKQDTTNCPPPSCEIGVNIAKNELMKLPKVPERYKVGRSTEWVEVKSVAEHLHVHHVVPDDARDTTPLHPLRLVRCLIERGNACFTRSQGECSL